MKHYRKPAGHYIQLEDSVPVSESLTPVCQRPSTNHVFSDNWSSDPLNPLVCWRLKTTQELDAEKQEKATNLIDYKTAIVALADVTYAVLKDPTKLPATRDAWLQAIKDRYKALI